MTREKIIIKTRFRYFWFLLYFSLVFCLANLSAQERETHPAIEHTPHVTFSHGEILEIRGSVKEEVEWMRFFFQYEEVEQFQARNMLRAENGSYVYEFDTSVLPCLEFEYYLAAKTVDKIVYYPLKAPTQLIRVRGESEEPLLREQAAAVAARGVWRGDLDGGARDNVNIRRARPDARIGRDSPAGTENGMLLHVSRRHRSCGAS